MAEAAADAGQEQQASGFLRLLSSLPLGGRTGLLVAVAATTLAIASVIWYGTRPEYKLLYANLPEQEAGRVVEQLGKMNIPYELGGGGTTIRIPDDKVYSVRLEMATQGIPKGEGVGFEIFDQSTMVGMTDFMQRMNYQRALQGELARTIESVAAVRKARVHLVLPKRSMFVSEEQQPSASVVMELGNSLNATQIDGIVHLIAAAVEGLAEDRVTLLDHKGNLIAGGKQRDATGNLAPDEGLAMQRQVEKTLEERLQTMLDRLLGPDRSIIRVTAELDLARVERMKEDFNPEGQVPRSEQTVTENSQGAFGVGGTPGVPPNDANETVAGGNSGSNQSRNVERATVNYEISKTVDKVLMPVGGVKRLSVAVLVDGVYKSPKEGEDKVYQARTQEEMEQLRRVVEQAVGFRKDRGDSIEVTNAPFEPVLPPVAEESPWSSRDFQLQAAKYAGLAILVLLLVLLVLRPLVKKLLIPERKVDRDGLPSTVADLEQQLLAEGVGTTPSKQPIKVVIPDRTLQLSQQMISDHSDEARDILRFWMTLDE